MNKNLILILLFGILFISLVSAEDLTFKQHEEIDLKLPCSYNGDNCDVSATCVLSVIYPNSTLMIENETMTNTGTGIVNYTLPDSTTLGDHKYKQTCCQSSLCASDTDTFTITSTGIGSNNTIPIFLLIFAVLLLVFGIILSIPMMGFFSGILFVLVGMYLLIYGFGNIADLYTRGFGLIILALGMVITIMAGFSWMEDY